MQALPSTEAILSTYDGWLAQQNSRTGNDLRYEGQSFRDSRMAGDTTFSRAEVAQMMDGQLQALVGAAIKSQEHVASSSRALMQAILRENDRQRVPVEVDANAVLNSGAALSAVELAEQRLAARATGGGRLGALPSIGGSEDTAKQLAEAHEEIRRLNERMRGMSAQFETAMKERSQMNSDVLQLQDTVGAMSVQQAEMTHQQQQQMQEQNAAYRVEIEKLRGAVLEAQRELTGKLAASTQFQSLKKMLNEKNDVVQKLRTALMRYDPAAAAAAGGVDDIEAEDDDDD